MPAGRPTTFNPEYCDFVREHMAAGLSKTAVAGMLGTSRQTFINWCGANPEFLDAIRDGEAARTLYLELGLLEAKDGPTVTSRIFALKNAAPHEWSDTQKVVGAEPDGGHKVKVEADSAFAAFAAILDGIAGRAARGPDAAGSMDGDGAAGADNA